MMMKLKQFCITFALAGITASIAMSAETKLYAVKYHRPHFDEVVDIDYCAIATIESREAVGILEEIIVEFLAHSDRSAQKFNIDIAQWQGEVWAIKGGPSRLAINFKSADKSLGVKIENELIPALGKAKFDKWLLFGHKYTSNIVINGKGPFQCISLPEESYTDVKIIFDYLSKDLPFIDRVIFDEVYNRIAECAQKNI